MALDIRLLGPPRVARDGAPVVFETRKAMALLAHLALAEHPRSRAGLCELLYPGAEPERARGALRRTLSGLRQGVGEEWVKVAGDSVSLERRAGLALDVERFRALAADGASVEDLEEAIGLYAGGFLEGFSLRDSPEFDDWQVATAAALERELTSMLRRLADALAARGDVEQAIAHARRLLALDPLQEPAHRQLIRLHAWNGDRAAAFEQYRTCVRTLMEELGVSPVQETLALYEQVSEGSLAPPAQPAPPRVRTGAVEAPGELPLVGRAAEIAMLFDAYAAAALDGAIAVIEGESGIGKTRLAHELAAHARAGGAVVLAARCFDDEAGLPYGPVVELLRQAVARGLPDGISPQRLADASLLLPDLAPGADEMADRIPPGGPAAQVRLLEAVVAILGASCQAAAPGVVFVDDVHAADAATVDALAYLGRRLAGRSLLLVLTWRTEAVPPGHRLRRLVVDLARDGKETTVSPARLAKDEVAELVRAAGPDGLEERIHLESEGLPLFVAEYLAALHAGGEAVFPTGLLDARLAGLDELARQVLGAAAAIGRSFDLDTLRHASGRSEEETVDALEQLVIGGLVREGADGYDFSHAKLRELAYEQTGLARRRLLHARAAEALAVRKPAGASAALVAHHLALAGDEAGAAEQHLLAGEHAASVHAHADAIAHLAAAIALGHPDVAVIEERIGDLLTLLGSYADALARYETARAACAPERAAVVDHKIGRVHHRRGDWERAKASFEAALAVTHDDGLGARIRADLSLTLHAAGDAHRARALALEALALSESAGDRRAEAQAQNMLGVLAAGAGDLDPAAGHLQRSLELAQELGDVQAEVAALNNLALIGREAGDFRLAMELTERALSLCSRFGDRHREAALENNLADLHHAAGREDDAMHHLKRAVAIFAEVGGDHQLPEIWKLVSW